MFNKLNIASLLFLLRGNTGEILSEHVHISDFASALSKPGDTLQDLPAIVSRIERERLDSGLYTAGTRPHTVNVVRVWYGRHFLEKFTKLPYRFCCSFWIQCHT